MFAVTVVVARHRVEGRAPKRRPLDVAEGSEIKIEDVLLLANGDAVQVGTPRPGTTVTAKLLSTIKVLRFAYSSRRKGFHKTIGHRQHFTQIEIVEIQG